MVEILQSVVADEGNEAYIVVRGRLDSTKAIEDVWMPVRKSLPQKGVAMYHYYKPETDTTRFNFHPTNRVLNEEYVAGLCGWLTKRANTGKLADQRVLVSRVGKKMASYMSVVWVADPENAEKTRAHIRVNRSRLDDDLMRTAIQDFTDELLRLFDGETPEEMARSYACAQNV